MNEIQRKINNKQDVIILMKGQSTDEIISLLESNNYRVKNSKLNNIDTFAILQSAEYINLLNEVNK